DADLLRAQALITQAQGARVQGDLNGAEALAGEALTIYGALDHQAGAAGAETVIANVRFDQRDLAGAEAGYRAAQQRYAEIGNQGGIASALNNRAVVLRQRGDLEQAFALYEEAASIYAAIRNLTGRANTLNNLAALQVIRGALTAAQARFEEALALWQQIESRRGVAYSLDNLGTVQRRLGQLADSRAAHERALALRREIGHRPGELASLSNLAAVLMEQGDLAGASVRLERALALARDLDRPRDEADVQHRRGELRRLQGRVDEAQSHNRDALDRRQQRDDHRAIVTSRLALAQLHLDADRRREAEAALEGVVRDARSGRYDTLAARAHVLLAEASLRRGDAPGATLALDAARLLRDGGVEDHDVRLRIDLVTSQIAARRSADAAAARAALEQLAERARSDGYPLIWLDAHIARVDTLSGVVGREWRTRLANEAAQLGYEGRAQRLRDAAR
ncbi:MAG: tetratricopeptide repeat protein, partial [Acidobacteriota bacterium]